MNAIGRRQKQAKANYRHIHKAKRPKYTKTDPDIARKRLDALVQRERERTQRKKVKK